MVKEISENEFDEIIKENKVVLVDFFATWCPPCRKLSPILDELSEVYGEKVKFVKINVDENETISRQFRIMNIPTVMLFVDGEMVKKQVGAAEYQFYEEIITSNI